MPAPASEQEALLLELLRQKGILADQRNLRLAPFTDASADANGASGAASVSPDAGAAPTSATDPNTPQPIDNGDGTFTDPVSGQVVSREQAQSMWPALFGGAAGAAMGYAAAQLARRRGVPTIEGEVINDPTIAAAPNEVAGEYTDVNEPSRAVSTSSEAANQSDKSPTSAEVLADRQRRLTGPKNALPPAAPAKYADVSPADMKRAQAIADELVKSRLLGNADPKKAPKRGVSTGPLNRESLLESVITAIRKAKIKPSTLAKAIP